MTDIASLSIAGMGAALRAGTVTSVELTAFALDRIEAVDPLLNAFVCVVGERALAEADRADRELAMGRDLGPLHGVPYGLKDVIDVAGIVTTAQSRLCLDNVAAGDSAVQERLRAGGAVLLGKQATYEFALGGPSHDPLFPFTRNPWKLQHLPGGSSAGSAAAVAAGICRTSIGTDSGGSIRVPANYCAAVGLKPTTGRVSRHGVFPLSYTLDHCGPISKDLLDAALTLNVIAGYDARDPASAHCPPEDFARHIGMELDGLKLGYAREVFAGLPGTSAELTAAMDAAAGTFAKLGATVEEIKLPPLELFGAVCIVIMNGEAFAHHAQDLRSRPRDFGNLFYERVVPGAAVTASDFIQATRLQRELARRLEASIFSRFDAVLTSGPAAPAPIIDAFSHGGRRSSLPSGSATYVASATGYPALAMPVGFTSTGLPLGMQLIGRAFDESTLFRIGAAFETETGFARRRPELGRPELGPDVPGVRPSPPSSAPTP